MIFFVPYNTLNIIWTNEKVADYDDVELGNKFFWHELGYFQWKEEEVIHLLNWTEKLI